MTRKAVSVERPASELQGKVFDAGVMLGTGSHDGLARLGRVGCLKTLLPRRSHPEMLDVANVEDGADFLSSLVSWGWRRQGLQLRDSPFPIPDSSFPIPHSPFPDLLSTRCFPTCLIPYVLLPHVFKSLTQALGFPIPHSSFLIPHSRLPRTAKWPQGVRSSRCSAARASCV
jgi:hypothetical protein